MQLEKLFHLMLILALSVPFGIFVAFNYKEYGLNYINDDWFLSLIGSLGSICNGVSRFFWGNLLDCFSYRIICISMCFIALCSCISLIWSVHNQYLYMISVLSSYFVYGGLFSIYPTQTVRILGKVLGPRLYYMTFMGFSIGVVIQYLAHILVI
jgi:MFS family permease